MIQNDMQHHHQRCQYIYSWALKRYYRLSFRLLLLLLRNACVNLEQKTISSRHNPRQRRRRRQRHLPNCCRHIIYSFTHNFPWSHSIGVTNGKDNESTNLQRFSISIAKLISLRYYWFSFFLRFSFTSTVGSVQQKSNKQIKSTEKMKKKRVQRIANRLADTFAQNERHWESCRERNHQNNDNLRFATHLYWALAAFVWAI